MNDDLFLQTWLGSHSALHRRSLCSFKSLEHFFRILTVMVEKERIAAPDISEAGSELTARPWDSPNRCQESHRNSSLRQGYSEIMMKWGKGYFMILAQGRQKEFTHPNKTPLQSFLLTASHWDTCAFPGLRSLFAMSNKPIAQPQVCPQGCLAERH